jgi:hypothetical protein
MSHDVQKKEAACIEESGMRKLLDATQDQKRYTPLWEQIEFPRQLNQEERKE